MRSFLSSLQHRLGADTTAQKKLRKGAATFFATNGGFNPPKPTWPWELVFNGFVEIVHKLVKPPKSTSSMTADADRSLETRKSISWFITV